MFAAFALLDPKVWIAFGLAIVLSAGAAAGAVFFWHLGKAEEIRLLAEKDGFDKGVKETKEEFERGKKAAAKAAKKKRKQKKHTQQVTTKLEKLADARPADFSRDCDLSVERVRVLDDALAGPAAAGRPDGAVRAPDPNDWANAERVRPDDDREREPGARLRGQGGPPAGVDPGD